MSASPDSLAADSRLPAVTLRTVGLHPLIYRKRILKVDRSATAGDLVEVRDADGRTAGFGLYNPRAELALRMLTWDDQPPDEAWWQSRLTAAVELRRTVLGLD